MDATQVERALRKTAQLRALTLSLRRASEAAVRERLLSEFGSFLQRVAVPTQGSGPVPLPSPEALLAGIKARWARGDYTSIQKVAGLLPKDLLDRHALLRAYLAAAAEQQSSDSSTNLGVGPEWMKTIFKDLRKRYGPMLKRLAG
jgi:hypothetical protein